MVIDLDLLDQLSCGEDERAEQALSHIAGWGREAVDALHQRLADPNVDVRWWAVRALAEIDDQRIPGLLVEALSDSDQSVRWCAGLALRIHPSELAIPALMGLLSDEDALTRRLAGDALVAIGKPAVTDLLDAVNAAQHIERLEAMLRIVQAFLKVRLSL